MCKRIIDGRAGMGQFQKETTGEHAYPATLSFHDGAPDCRMEGEERAVFEGDRISLLEDTVSDEKGQRLDAYMEAHGGWLKAVG